MGATMQQEMAAAIDLLADAYEELKAIAPQHELLRFITGVKPDKVIFTNDETLSKEFGERFPSVNPNSNARHKIYSFIRYRNAIIEATKNAKGSTQ